MDDRAFLDQLDHELDAGTPPLIGKDAHVFETDEDRWDPSREHEDEGASCLLAQTTNLKHPLPTLADPRQRAAPR